MIYIQWAQALPSRKSLDGTVHGDQSLVSGNDLGGCHHRFDRSDVDASNFLVTEKA